jgi:uncharacterized membrane protein
MKSYDTGAPSTAAIKGHPLHPMFIVFPAAFIIGLLVADIVFAGGRSSFWAWGSRWVGLGGVVMGGFAAIFGMTDFASIQRAREVGAGWAHAALNVTAVVLTLINLVMRWGNPVAFILPAGIIISAISAGCIMAAVWLGGELTFRYGVGVLVNSEIKHEDKERLSHAA